MNKVFLIHRIGVSVLLILALTACGTLKKAGEGSKADYKTSKTAPRLEVPPDLTSSTIDNSAPFPGASSAATYSDYVGQQGKSTTQSRTNVSRVLPEQTRLRVERDGDRQWLVVQGEPDQIWPVVRQFWVSNGFVIKLDDARIGIMETDWAENRADIPKGPLRKVIGKAFDFVYSSSTRDKFRVRLERGMEEGTTELFLTHRGMEEVVQGEPGDETNALWRPRPSDPELEAEMLKRLMVQLGIQQQRAETLLAQRKAQQPKARLVEEKGGMTTLVLAESFAPAWRRTGIALDRVGFVVEDRNRSLGMYFVRYDDPEKSVKKRGWVSKLNPFGKKSADKGKKYRIQISGDEEGSRVMALNGEGKPDKTGASRRILSLLYDQLK